MPSFSHASIVRLTAKDARGSILAPNIVRLQDGTFGYVRSIEKAQSCPRWKAGDSVPFRDYSATDVLTDSRILFDAPYAHSSIVVGLRNSVNEFLFRLRIVGRW